MTIKRNRAAYYGKKLLIFLVSVVLLSMTVFVISRLTPTDPLQAYYGERTEKMSVSCCSQLANSIWSFRTQTA